ncbi:hypothetical protein [Phenylobacterium sp.]|jgi:hypothetical protein|uniref:hypothetical protein n=1 Tax=Phenylobacterium sp. TaxID=1871053 RepID=UPI002F929310
MRLISSLIVIAALAAGAAEAGPYKAPRNKAGQPDFQGIWTNTALTFLTRPPIIKGLVPTPEEQANFKKMFLSMAGEIASDAPIDPNKPAPPEVKEVANADFLEMDMNFGKVRGQVRSSWIIEPSDGKIALTDEGRALGRAKFNGKTFDNPENRPVDERCLTAIGRPEGPPMMNTGFNGHYQFVQTEDHVAILVEMNHDVRIVRLKDHKRPHKTITPWMGDSIGWWEGDTLVVETTQVHPNGASFGSMMGNYAFKATSVVRERFTRIGKDELLYEFTVDDPTLYAKPWKAEMSFRPATGPIYEYACHEGNYSLTNILAGARVQEKEAAKAPPSAAKPGVH